MIATIVLVISSAFFAYCHLTKDQAEEQYYEMFLKEVKKDDSI